MQPFVPGNFRMKRNGHRITFSDSDDCTVGQSSDDIDPRPHAFHHGSPNKGHRNRGTLHPLDREVCFEGIALGTKGISLDQDVETPEGFLTLNSVFDVISEHDHSGTRSKNRQSALQRLPYGSVQAENSRKLVDHARLPTRNNEPVYSLELRWGADFANGCSQLREDGRVFSHVPLEREYSYGEAVTNHVRRAGGALAGRSR